MRQAGRAARAEAAARSASARLSVTEIEDWLRDPYTIYAKHILRLSPLDPVDMPLSAADRGSAIHGAIGDFAERFRERCRTNAEELLRAMGDQRFAPLMDRPEARALWWPRFLRIANWYAGWEQSRRDGLLRILAEQRGHDADPAGRRSHVHARPPAPIASRSATTALRCSISRPARRRATSRCASASRRN